MIKNPRLLLVLSVFLGLGLTGILAGCNMPGAASSQANLDVTQAYQTIQAKLTFAVGQTPVGTSSPTGSEPSPTATISPQEDASVTPTQNSTINATVTTNPQVTADSCDLAAAGYPKIDITIEDDTAMEPGESFTKIWRVENVGTCTWTKDYDAVFFSGEIMDASSSQPLESSVVPGSSIDISVNMVAPAQAGTYQGNWKLRNADGVLFGIGPGGESPFWVRIKVISDVAETVTIAPSPTPTAEVQASGSITLVLDDGLDLDNLSVNAGNPDLRYRTTIIDLRYQLFPVIGVTVSVFGDSQPTLSDCQTANLANAPIFLNDLPVGTYICHRTNLGLPGWTRFDGIDPDTEMVTLLVLTWKMP